MSLKLHESSYGIVVYNSAEPRTRSTPAGCTCRVNTMACSVRSAQEIAVTDYRERFNQVQARATCIHDKVSTLKLDQQGKDLVYCKVEEVTRQTQKGLNMISEVEDVLVKVGPSKKKDKSTALALRAAQGKLVKAISYRQHQADHAIRLAYKALISAQEDTVRRNKASGIKMSLTTSSGLNARREYGNTTMGKLKCDNLVESYTDDATLQLASEIVHQVMPIPLVSSRFTVDAEQIKPTMGLNIVEASEHKLALHLAATVKTDGKVGVPRGMNKPALRFENVDDYVLINNGTSSKDSQMPVLLSEAISDANIDSDVCARTVVVPDNYSKVKVSFVGTLTAGDVMAMTSGVYSDSSTIMRQAIELRQFEADAKTRCGRHMHEGLDEIWQTMRGVISDEGLDNVTSALRWIQITKWLTAQNNTSGGLTQITVQSRMGHMIMKYSHSVASNVAEAIVLASPGLTYKTVKSVLSGLSVHAMSQNGVIINEVAAPSSALAAVNKIEMVLLRHVNGPAAIRWLRAYILSQLDVCMKITAPIQENSSYRAAHKLKNYNVFESSVTVRLRRVPFDCEAGDLLLKACVEDGPIVRKAKYGRRNIFDDNLAIRACAVPITKVLYAIDELPTKGVITIQVTGTSFVGYKPQSKSSSKKRDESYSGGGGYHGTTDDYRDVAHDVGYGDLDGGNYVECSPDMFDDVTGGI